MRRSEGLRLERSDGSSEAMARLKRRLERSDSKSIIPSTNITNAPPALASLAPLIAGDLIFTSYLERLRIQSGRRGT